MSTTNTTTAQSYTGTYTPSGFAIPARRGRFAVKGSQQEVAIDDGGQAPKIGSRAWLYSWPGDNNPTAGKVTDCQTHCNGAVTVTTEFAAR